MQNCVDFYYYRNENTVKKNNTRDSPRFFYAALHFQVIFAREEKKGKTQVGQRPCCNRKFRFANAEIGKISYCRKISLIIIYRIRLVVGPGCDDLYSLVEKCSYKRGDYKMEVFFQKRNFHAGRTQNENERLSGLPKYVELFVFSPFQSLLLCPSRGRFFLIYFSPHHGYTAVASPKSLARK